MVRAVDEVTKDQHVSFRAWHGLHTSYTRNDSSTATAFTKNIFDHIRNTVASNSCMRRDSRRFVKYMHISVKQREYDVMRLNSLFIIL